MAKNEMSIAPFFATPLMSVQLDFDLEKLSEFAFEMRNKDNKGIQKTNRGGWHSNSQIYIQEKKHEEFIGLKKEINQYLQIYHSEIFQGMTFKGKGNILQSINGMWVNINEKGHYNDWHIHSFSTLSGVYYIKHDGSDENGNILFKHPNHPYTNLIHWPPGLVEKTNEVTSEIISIIPKSNMLLIFPAWLEHKAEVNLKNDSRISLSVNSIFSLEKKS